MNQYDSYNPEIFYPDENRGVEPLPPAPEPENNKKRSNDRKPKKKPTVKKRVVNKAPRTEGSSQSVSVFTRIKEIATSTTTRLTLGIILFALTAYLGVSFFSYFASCISDQALINHSPIGSLPDVANKGGEGGARLSELLINEGFGLGSLIIVGWLLIISLKLLTNRPRYKTVNFTIKCIIALITLSLIIGLVTLGANTPVNWGGYHGRYVNEFIIGFIGWTGAVILSLMMLAIFVVICLRDFVNWIIRKRKAILEKRRIAAEIKAEEMRRREEVEEMRRREEENAVLSGEHMAVDEPKEEEMPNPQPFAFEASDNNDDYLAEYALPDHPDLMARSEESSEHQDAEEYSERQYAEDSTQSPEEESDTDSETDTDDSEKNPEEAASSDSEDSEESEESGVDVPMVVNVNQIEKADVSAQDYRRTSMYQTPPLSLLEERETHVSVDPTEQLVNKERIRKTLEEFGIPIVSIEATAGPTVTLYEIRPDKGHRVQKIKSLTDDLALSLSASTGVRIIAPIPGRGTVGIEVANEKPQMVSMYSLMQSKTFQESKAILPLALGSTISNEVYVADLASIPHLLVAGATGQGKSVGLNVIISSLLYKKRPDELKFVLFDPKMVEFSRYAAIEKHFLAKLPDEEEAIITEMSKVVPTLNSLCVEMDNRYRMLKKAEVVKLEAYNALVKAGKLDPEEGHKFLPHIVIVVDEFADLMMTAGKEAEIPIARLAQKARAVGMHVIIATQRPSATVITGNIKANFPGRMAFRVGSGIDSKVILDSTGAEKLIGRGDMLILNNSEVVRVQCAFIDTPEVKRLCEYISSQPVPAEDCPYILPLPRTEEATGESNGGGFNLAEKDPLYEEVKQYVITSGTASTSNIQRRYAIGYNRAGKIMDQLEAAGIVGPNQGGKPRAVLVDSF